MPRSDLRQPNSPEEIPRGLFTDPDPSLKTLQTLEEIFLDSGSTFSLSELRTTLVAALQSSPDPDMFLMNFLRFGEATPSRTSLFNDLLRFAPLFELLARIFSHSQYFSDILVRDPALFRWLTASGALEGGDTGAEVTAEIDRIKSTFNKTESRLDALRRLYRREVLRIGTRDILGQIGLEQCTKELSDLAAALIQSVVEIADDELREKFGTSPETPFAVIGLGKLGGAELNYSSDIDIIFVYGEDETLTDRGGKELSVHQYYNRAAERVVQMLSGVSAEGHMYRVDTRLRPEGGAGPLARSLTGYMVYYETRGDLWERQMLIKARPLAGDRKFGKEFISMLSPFVYPRTHFSHPAEEISRIKNRIESTLGEKDNIKLRAGGIRDIEFVVQALQLLHGGQATAIREVNTSAAIHKLRLAGFISDEDATSLASAYFLFRNVEHRLQMALNTQTHTIPSDERSRNILAKRLGFDDAKGLEAELRKNLGSVKKIFDAVMGTDRVTSGDGIDLLLRGEEGGGSEMAEQLSRFGLRDVQRGIRNLRMLLTGSALTTAKMHDKRVGDAFRSIFEMLLGEMKESAVPDMTLDNFALLASEFRFPEQFYRHLKEPGFRKLIIGIAASSPRFTKGLVRHPGLLEEINEEISSLPEGSSKTDLVKFRNREELKAGIRNILGSSTFHEMTAAITSIADNVVAAVGLDRSVEAGLGKPGIAVFALGKYGTGELSFDGDLDILFICRPGMDDEKAAMERFAQEVLTSLQSVTESGTLYDVDARLRPEGRNAPLVTDFPAYQKYLSSRASLWERQSLTRLRLVWGDEDLGRDVLSMVDEFIYYSDLPPDWVDEVVEMRKSIESRSRTSRTDFLDVKLGPGGMVDVEFLAQMSQLRFGREVPDLKRLRTDEVIRKIPDTVLGGEARNEIREAYMMFREIEKLIHVTLEERNTVLPTDERLEILSRCYNGTSGGDLRDLLSSTMERVRTLFLSSAEHFRGIPQ